MKVAYAMSSPHYNGGEKLPLTNYDKSSDATNYATNIDENDGATIMDVRNSNNISTKPSQTTATQQQPPPSGEQRETWGRKLEFILTCVGYCVGLGNVWR